MIHLHVRSTRLKWPHFMKLCFGRTEMSVDKRGGISDWEGGHSRASPSLSSPPFSVGNLD